MNLVCDWDLVLEIRKFLSLVILFSQKLLDVVNMLIVHQVTNPETYWGCFLQQIKVCAKRGEIAQEVNFLSNNSIHHIHKLRYYMKTNKMKCIRTVTLYLTYIYLDSNYCLSVNLNFYTLLQLMYLLFPCLNIHLGWNFHSIRTLEYYCKLAT